MSASDFDFERLEEEDVMLPTSEGDLMLEGHDGAWMTCEHPMEVRD
ncbi:hypothetical protein [Haloferax sp. Atlit-12N]|nr:hypothetical protein [Haloferax sp. Atlit-12N]